MVSPPPSTSADAPATTTTEASNAGAPSTSEDDLEKILSREASALQRELEVERILKSFKLKCVISEPLLSLCDAHVHCFACALHALGFSPYDILDVEDNATHEVIKKRFRQLSLCESSSPSLTRPLADRHLNLQLYIPTSAHTPALRRHLISSRRLVVPLPPRRQPSPSLIYHFSPRNIGRSRPIRH
jgi:hypothetical protein